MSLITIHQKNFHRTIEAKSGISLLQIIRNEGFEIYAPCGGNGTCGKCRVQIKGESTVTACTFHPTEDIEVILAEGRESRILSTQYEYSVSLPLLPGEIVNNVSYPIGIAIDIGTTTVVLYFISLITSSIIKIKGILNPQTAFGADVISRIQYCSNAGGLKQLQNAIIEQINNEIAAYSEDEGISEDMIVKISIAGNNTMLHILLGIDPTSIALAPFTPVFTESKLLNITDLGFHANKAAEIHILPSISAYVGADIVAGIASLDPPASIKNYLFIDLGTNGEMALITPEKIYCCATAAGPAFEGANISCGMGAFPGAISEFIDPSTYKTIANEKAVGICGSGLIDIISYLLLTGNINPDGNIEDSICIVKGDSETENITISQQDIREIQLAKAAVIAGIKILVKSAQLSLDTIDTLFLAGGFGNYINSESAIVIGLLPKELRHKIIPIGNTSGTGASLALKSTQFDNRIKDVLDKAEYIELSSHDDFVLEYAMNMGFTTVSNKL